MTTIFPLSASTGQIFQGYSYNGTAWEIIGEDWKPNTYSPTPPDYAESGFIWIDSDEDIEEVDFSQYVTASGHYILSNKAISGSSNYLSEIPQSAISGLEDTLENLDTLPSQSGNNGKYLTTDGSVASWGEIDLSTKQDKVFEVSDTEIGYLAQASSIIQNQLDSKAPLNLSVIEAKTGAYTISSGDEGSLIQLSGSNAYTVSIPTDAIFNFSIGTQINLINIGTGVKTIAAVTPGTTSVNGTPGLKLRAQWSSATLIKLSSNIWVVVGDLSA